MTPPDNEMRRARTIRVKLQSHARKRQRFAKVDTWARQRLTDAALATTGDKRLTPQLSGRVTVGDTISLRGRHWIVGAVCRCSPVGWTRLDPMREEGEDGPLPPPYRFPMPCAHNMPSPGPPSAPIEATLWIDYDPATWSTLGRPHERYRTIRERHVDELLEQAIAAEAADKPDLARRRLFLAVRADAMTDEEFLIERQMINRLP